MIADASFIRWLRKTHHEGRYKKVVSQLKNGNVFDIGCGRPCETMPDQAFLRYLNRPDSVGMDIKPVEGPYRFIQGSIEAIPLPDATFDNVAAMEVIEHVANWQKALSEIKRVTKPGGMIVISTPDCGRVWDLIWDTWTKSVGHMWHDAHVVTLSSKDWIKILSEHFKLIRIQRHWNYDVIYTCMKK